MNTTLTAPTATDAFITDTGNCYTLDRDGYLVWICTCGLPADTTHIFFDQAREATVVQRSCYDCAAV